MEYDTNRKGVIKPWKGTQEPSMHINHYVEEANLKGSMLCNSNCMTFCKRKNYGDNKTISNCLWGGEGGMDRARRIFRAVKGFHAMLSHTGMSLYIRMYHMGVNPLENCGLRRPMCRRQGRLGMYGLGLYGNSLIPAQCFCEPPQEILQKMKCSSKGKKPLQLSMRTNKFSDFHPQARIQMLDCFLPTSGQKNPSSSYFLYFICILLLKEYFIEFKNDL